MINKEDILKGEQELWEEINNVMKDLEKKKKYIVTEKFEVKKC